MSMRFDIHRLSVAVLFLATGVALLGGCSGIKIERPLQAKEGDWPTFAGSPSRTALTEKPIVPPLVQQWEFDVSAGIGNGSPLMVDGTLLVGNLRGELYAADGQTGKRIGWIKLGEAIQGSPAVDGSMVYVGVANTNESLVAFDLRTGKAQWKREYGDIEASPLLMNQRLYVGNIQGQFFCVEPVGGEMVWRYEIPRNKVHDGFRSSPAGQGSTVVVGGEDGNVYAFDASSGNVRWTFETGSNLFAAPSIADSLVFIGDMAGTMFALELESGRLIWRYRSGSPIYGNAAVADNAIFFGNLAGFFIALRADSGAELWRSNLASPINTGPAVAGDYLYIGTLKKYLFAIRRNDGSVAWSQELEGRIKTSPAAVNGQLLVATDDWVVLSFTGSAQ